DPQPEAPVPRRAPQRHRPRLGPRGHEPAAAAGGQGRDALLHLPRPRRGGAAVRRGRDHRPRAPGGPGQPGGDPRGTVRVRGREPRGRVPEAGGGRRHSRGPVVDRLIALVVVRFKLELRAFCRARERALGLALAAPGVLILSGAFSLVAFFGTRALQARNPELVLPVLSVVATGLGLLWALSPILTGLAFTETHDLTRLLHFPIPLGTLVASSLIANLAQPMVLAHLPVLLALALALSSRLATFPFALAGVVLAFVFILAAAQLAGLALHAVSRNRRYHDV